jgi:diguanylate cyclase (GGDEF)-like protein/PAS domain S-box-containing protein
MQDLTVATLRAFNENAPQGILTTDSQLNICYWNQWLEIHSGRMASEMMGRNLLEVYPELVQRKLDRFYQQALAGQGVVLSHRFHHHLLTMRPTLSDIGLETMEQSVRIAPLVEQNQIIGTITVIKDVTERVTREAELLSHIAKLNETEEALRRSEAHFRSLIENASDLITILDCEGTLRYVTPPIERMLGYRVEDLIDRNIFHLIHPDDLSTVMNALSYMSSHSGAATSVEFRIRHRDGSWHTLEAMGKNLPGADGIPSVLINSRDITIRKQAEQALSWEFKANAALAGISTEVLAHLPVEDISAHLLEHAERLTASTYGFVGYIDPDSGHLVAPTLSEDLWDNCQVVDKMMILSKFGGLWGWVLQHREAVLSNNPADDPRSSGTPAGHFPIKNFLSVPAFIGENLVGQIALANAAEDYSERDLALVERLATLYAIAIQHRRAEDELREERNFVSTILDTAGALVVVLNRDGQIIRFNRACEQTTGYSFEDTKGRSFWEVFVAAQEMERVVADFRRLQSGQQVQERENHWVTRSGEQRLIAWSSSVLFDSDGMVKYIIGTGIDVTERQQAEAALQKSKEDLTAWVNELEMRNREITLLNEMTDLLQTCVNTDEAHDVIAQSLHQLFATESGALFGLSESRNFLETMAVWGDALHTERIFAAEECWAVRRGRLHVVEDSGSGLLCRHVNQPLVTGYLCMPMMAQGEVLGILYLQSTDPGVKLSESKQRVAVTVTEHIALALANLKLRETLRNQSIRDPLTGLFNRRYMEESLELEMSRAARSKRSLGVIMIDIDHFKHFNDSFGHEAGDLMLRELGAFLQTHIREGDIACRYGGEEFTLILPEASLEVVRQRADQLREEFKFMKVQVQGQSLGPVTLSLGVALFPRHGASIETLLRMADQALYRAKAAGRDRVEVACFEGPTAECVI